MFISESTKYAKDPHFHDIHPPYLLHFKPRSKTDITSLLFQTYGVSVSSSEQILSASLKCGKLIFIIIHNS